MARRIRAEAPSEPVRVRLSPVEKQMARDAAHINRQKLSAFIRDAIVSAAGDCLELPRRKSRAIFITTETET